LLNLTTIMKLYRGEKNTYQNSYAEHQHLLNELLGKIRWHYTTLAAGLNDAAAELKIELKAKAEMKFTKPANHEEAEIIFQQFNLPIEAAIVFINKWQEEIIAIEKKIERKKIEEKEGKKQIQTLRSKINYLNKPIVNFIEETKEYYEQTKQGINDWKHFMEWFVNGEYHDIEGLCKIVSLDEVKENEFTLTPGRYVGIRIEVDEKFDYKKRIKEISKSIFELNNQSINLVKSIENNLKQLV